MTQADRHPNRVWLWVERLAWATGLTALGVWSVAHVSGTMGTRRALQQFAALRTATAQTAADPTPDLSLWAPDRIRAWLDAQTKDAPAPLGVLRIPRIGVEAPVLAGTDDWTLNRGVGHIEGTAKPGTAGNAGIAGHRDGFFRALKDIAAGDVLVLETPGSVDNYRVERTWIVGPDDVSVLDPTTAPTVTLVTCYPFYFIGSAPQRFIVRAVRTETTAPRQSPEQQGTGRQGTRKTL